MTILKVLVENKISQAVFCQTPITKKLFNLSQTSPGFTCLPYKSFENTVGKGEIARHKQFLLFPQCFLPICRTFCHFYQIRNCHLQTLLVWRSLKFVVWERVKQKFLWMLFTPILTIQS